MKSVAGGNWNVKCKAWPHVFKLSNLSIASILAELALVAKRLKVWNVVASSFWQRNYVIFCPSMFVALIWAWWYFAPSSFASWATYVFCKQAKPILPGVMPTIGLFSSVVSFAALISTQHTVTRYLSRGWGCPIAKIGLMTLCAWLLGNAQHVRPIVMNAPVTGLHNGRK